MRASLPAVLLAVAALAAITLGDGRDTASAAGSPPLSFEPNRGQTAPAIRYFARGPGYGVFLTRREAVLAVRDDVVRLRPLGASREARIVPIERLAATSNYFHGNDPAKWLVRVPNFAGVAYRGLYPGIDLVFHGNRGRLEYDFVVAPGAEPSRIRLELAGASVDGHGKLLLRLGHGVLQQPRPTIYQLVDGRRRLVNGGYVVRRNEVRFRIGAYDRTRELVIDPVIAYSTYLGGSDADAGFGIATDGAGNAYVTGLTSSVDFPTENPYQGALDGTRSDVFVTKIGPDGKTLVYSTYVGGSVGDIGWGIDVDDAGNAYVTGTTGGSISANDFPMANAYDATYGGTDDAFLFKLSPDGSSLLYSTYLGGTNTEIGQEVAVNRSTGEAYVVGHALGADFPTTAGALKPAMAASDSADGFVTKFAANGQTLAYSTFLGGPSGSDPAHDLALDGSGNVYVTGTTFSPSFPVTPGAFQTTCTGCNLGRSDAYVAKLNPQGSALLWATYLGGSIDEQGFGIGVDAGGNAYVTGSTESTSASTKPFPTTPGAFQPTSPSGIPNAYVSKLSADGSTLAYSTYLGGSGPELGRSLTVDGAGNAYVTGRTGSPDFPTVTAPQPGLAGAPDAFVTVLNSTGSAPLFSTYVGGISTDEGFGVVLDGSGNAYVAGETWSANFAVTPGAFQTTFGSAGGTGRGGDAFAVKFSCGCAAPTAVLVRGFAARASRGRVTLTWRTASEAGVLGFHVYRGSTRLDRRLIRARGGGHTYRFMTKKTGRYRLEVVLSDGRSRWFGPVSAARA